MAARELHCAALMVKTLALGLALSTLFACSGGDTAPEPDATALDAPLDGVIDAAVDAPAIDAPAIDAAIDALPIDAAVDAIPIDADPSAPLPILRYRFEASALDEGSLGPAYPGLVSSATFVPGVHGQGLHFAGTQASVFSIPGSAGVFSARPSLTIGLWFREDTVLASGPFVRYLLDNRCCFMQDDRGFQAYHGVSGAPLTTCSGGGCATITYPVGAWHHLLYRYATSGAPLEIFLDGNPIATIANLNHIPIFGAGVGDLRVGYNTNFSVDDLEVYDQVFSAADQCRLIVGGAWTGTACTPPTTP